MQWLHLLSTLSILFNIIVLVNANSYPVPIPPHKRQGVHGWLILPVDQNLPSWNETATPVDAWFSHHVPDFFQYSPHDFQLILRGKLTPLPTAGDEVVPILLPYPPKHNLLQNEYTFTPPPPFSLNDLLSGELVTLQGVVYNGSFDTTYERKPMNIARLDVNQLTTAVWLNYSTEVVPYENLQYYSYPRSVSWNSQTTQHLYLAHTIHAEPDFDQVVHVTIDLNDCVMLNGTSSYEYSSEDMYDMISVPGLSWSFPNTNNLLADRLLPSSSVDIAITMPAGEAIPIQCPIQVLEEIHCTVGPAFADRCPQV